MNSGVERAPGAWKQKGWKGGGALGALAGKAGLGLKVVVGEGQEKRELSPWVEGGACSRFGK